MSNISIYIHIPFCASKCLYCDFNSFEPKVSKVNAEHYIKHLLMEMDMYKNELKSSSIKSVFFGGGTPSLVDSNQIGLILEKLKALSTFTSDAEITVECNPESLTEEKLKAYQSFGVNRLSIGLQATQNDLLKRIGRIHTYETFEKAYFLAREIGFNNINVDLMFGLPSQTKELFSESIEQVLQLKPEHIASYSLKVEEGTPLYVLEGQGLFKQMDEEKERELYHLLIQKLEDRGIYQYELSNFSKPKMESRHNLTYWHNEPYLGFGASAHSKFDDFRFSNFSDLEIYCEMVSNQTKPIADNQFIDKEDDLFETIMLGLRLNQGIDIKRIEEKYGIDFMRKYEAAIENCLKNELIVLSDHNMRLTLKGRDLSNQVFVAFL